ncbi:hypothetical protein KSF_028270 [Reticulibacter mediterranei]|uniref:Uncharacterized protein n=1 Tax=Reticulibacter mediterranei TaxID=2778369 RepID=A0A8J3IJV4_9CHLR|nr:hypothetical protein KSF_028270 [Reticulibacter mediterranei]
MYIYKGMRKLQALPLLKIAVLPTTMTETLNILHRLNEGKGYEDARNDFSAEEAEG